MVKYFLKLAKCFLLLVKINFKRCRKGCDNTKYFKKSKNKKITKSHYNNTLDFSLLFFGTNK